MAEFSGLDARSTESEGRANRRLRVRLMCTVLLIEAILLLWFIRRDAVLILRLNSLFQGYPTQDSLDPQVLFRDDAKLGSALPSNQVGQLLRHRADREGSGYFVVAIGDCASCIKADLPSWELECKKRHLSMVVVSTSLESATKAFSQRLKIHSLIVSDPNRQVLQYLNPVWAGRPYLFTREWKLAWIPRMIGAASPFQVKEFETALEELQGGQPN